MKPSPDALAKPAAAALRATAALSVACLLMLRAATALGVAAGAEPPDLKRQSWGAAEGLPGGAVRALAEGGDGRMWVATDQGVARFDGARWIPLSKAEGSERAADVVALAVDGAGTVWLAPARGEPLCLRGPTMSDCVPDGHHVADEIRISDFEPDPKGGMWFSVENLVYQLAGGELRWVSSFPKESGRLHDVELAADGRLWIGAERGLFFRDTRGEIHAHEVIEGGVAPEVLALAKGAPGTLNVAGQGFVLRMSRTGEHLVRARGPEGLPDWRFMDVHEDRAGTVWLAGDGGLVRWTPATGKLQSFTARDGLPAGAISVVHEDWMGGLWVGAHAGGLTRFTDRPPLVRTSWLLGLIALGAAALALGLRALRRPRSVPAPPPS